MMEFECGVYKSPITNSLKRERNMSAVDLSMSAKKKSKNTSAKNLQFQNGKIDEISNSHFIFEEDEEDDDEEEEVSSSSSEVITQVMDIQEPLSELRKLLEKRLGLDLSAFQIWLQDKFKMQPNKSLGDQCIQSEGLAQIKVELKQLLGNNRINIIDVLKLPEDEVDGQDDDIENSVEDLSVKNSESPNPPSKWSICKNFNSLFPIPLPNNPNVWSESQIRHWLRWAMQEFNIEKVNDSMWNITGEQLCSMSLDEFRKNVPIDPQQSMLLWTHIELLRKCRVFAIVEKPENHSQISLTQTKPSQSSSRKPRTSSSSSGSSNGNGHVKHRPYMTGHNGQIQLWQFLLELLGDRNKKNVIQWVGQNGEFKLIDPELVAQMWGERKNKPKMNYEKLSRALRYYYSEAMIAKVHGRRFVYKFVCNLKELVGYTATELISMVEDDVS